MIPYSLHVAMLLTACLVFYKLLLQKETYYRLNRLILLVCLVLTFILPLVSVPRQFSLRRDEPEINNTVVATPVINTNKSVLKPTSTQSVIAPTPITQRLIKLGFWLYWCGVAVFGFNFLLQIIVLLYQAYKKPVIIDGIYRIVELDDDKAPCSFGNNIFINPAKYDLETYNQILIHEKVHIQQGHSFDLILAELMLVMQWFNPFAWLYRKELENNLEFLTDNTILHYRYADPASYQLSLLKVSVPNFSMRVTTNYNQSLLKKRILMMNAKKSNIHATWKYLMLVPVLVTLICCLNKPVAISGTLAKLQQAASSVKLHKSNVALYVAGKPSVNFISRSGIDNFIKNTNNENILPAAKAETIAYNTQSAAKTENVKSVIDSNVGNTNLNDIAALQSNSITADYVKGFASIGYRNFTASDIIALNRNGITADYVKGFASIGYRNLTASDIIYLNRNGITADYAKGFASIGYRNLTAIDIVYLNSKGITADYVKGFASIGYRNLTASDIIYLNRNGITADYAKGFASIGYRNLTAIDIVYLNSKGITADYVKGFVSIGYRNFTASDIIALNRRGITADYVKGFASIGYRNLSANDIISLHSKKIISQEK